MSSVQTPTAADSAALRQLLDEAGAAPRLRPTPERRTEIDHALRAVLHRLTPRVQEQADRLNRGTRAWYARDRALAEAREALRTGLSPSSLAACLRLTELARAVRALDEFTGGPS
jgi:hypothetical protein